MQSQNRNTYQISINRKSIDKLPIFGIMIHAQKNIEIWHELF